MSSFRGSMWITDPKQANYLQPCKHSSVVGMKTSPFLLLTNNKILESQNMSMCWSVQWTRFQDKLLFSTTYCMNLEQLLHGLCALVISMRGAVVKLHSANTLYKWFMCKAAAVTLCLTVMHQNMAASQNYLTKKFSKREFKIKSLLSIDYMNLICMIDYPNPTGSWRQVLTILLYCVHF